MIGPGSIALTMLSVIFIVIIILAGRFILARKKNLAREKRSSQDVIRESERNLSAKAGGKTRLTVLVENNMKDGLQGLQPAHGIAILVEREGKMLLLDTGPGEEFIMNAAALGKKIEDVDFAFISHGHYDHGGGLARFLEKNTKAPICLSRLAVEERHFAKLAGVIRKDVSIDAGLAARYPGRFRYIDRVTEISPGIFIIPDIGHVHRMPSGNSIIFKESGGTLVPDDFAHEQVLVIQDRDGLVVFSGCCHNGVLNVVDAVAEHFPGAPVKAVIGGFHLYNPVVAKMDEKPDEVKALGGKMAGHNVKKFISGHCTGMEAFLLLKNTLGDRLEYFSTGMEFTL